jgi:hypothetical protein
MNKLTRAVKLGLLVGRLVLVPFANAAKKTSSVKIDEAKHLLKLPSYLFFITKTK